MPTFIDTPECDGRKDDADKPPVGLLPARSLLEIAKVLAFGAKKYSPDNWKVVPNAKQRYLDAALRHLFAYMDGEELDPESGLSHLSHAGTCILFLIWFHNA